MSSSKPESPRFDSICVVKPREFDNATAQTPGSKRLAAIPTPGCSNSQMWAGLFFVEPGAQTAIHHHGAQETIVYVLEGEAIIRWGEHGESELIASPGDFLRVPPFLPHQEKNRSSSTTFSWVVVRSTPEPIVINLPDDYWN
jgi:uncharacterized RmlC-like cupin family protein